MNAPVATDTSAAGRAPSWARGWLGLFFLGAVLITLADLIVHRHPSFAGETTPLPLELVPGFYSGYGFVAHVLLVVVAAVLRLVVLRTGAGDDR